MEPLALAETDPTQWDPAAAHVACQHATAIYGHPDTYAREVVAGDWEGAWVLSQGAAQCGLAWCSRVILISPRGTSGYGDVFHDLGSVVRVGWRPVLPAGIRVGWGFRQQSRALEGPLLAWLSALRADYPEARIVIDGHSLGGANGNLLASLLHHHGVPVAAVWTFGSPRVGSRKWAAWYEGLGIPTWRIARAGGRTLDLIHRVPKRSWGFRHVGRAVILVDGQALHGDEAWQEYRRRRPVGSIAAWRILSRLARGVGMHGGGKTAATLKTLQLAAVQKRG